MSALLSQARHIMPEQVKTMLAESQELAFIDVREAGEFAETHPFLAVSIPLSRFEPTLVRLVPRRTAPLILFDDGRSGRARWAANLAMELGYEVVAVMSEGVVGWQKAGFGLYAGVYVPSKTFGELLEEARHIPTIGATDLAALKARGENILLLDGRPMEEHIQMCIPDSLCLPNGELPLRVLSLLKDETTPIVVHCAGRTRSIVGAATLALLGLRNPVMALENGTQGWVLAGFDVEKGSTRYAGVEPSPEQLGVLKSKRTALARQLNVPFVDAETMREWSGDQKRTTYVLDVRTSAEYAAAHVDGAIHAPGGQLVQSTDLWIAVRGARVVLVDDGDVRALFTAHWLKLMGWNVAVLADPAATPQTKECGREPQDVTVERALTIKELRALQERDLKPILLDLRSSMAFRKSHLVGSIWVTRSQVPSVLASHRKFDTIVLVTDDLAQADLVARDLTALSVPIRIFSASQLDQVGSHGFSIEASPFDPPDSECIDFVFFVHDRHHGNLEAAKRYLSWEKGLVAQLDYDERRMFRV